RDSHSRRFNLLHVDPFNISFASFFISSYSLAFSKSLAFSFFKTLFWCNKLIHQPIKYAQSNSSGITVIIYFPFPVQFPHDYVCLYTNSTRRITIDTKLSFTINKKYNLAANRMEGYITIKRQPLGMHYSLSS